MTQEEKARAYDKAMERAKCVIEQNPLMEYLKKGIEHIFPELKESEDEKIRKCVKYALDCLFKRTKYACDVKANNVYAWLEKQPASDSFSVAEQEKREFVGDGFIKCYADFQDFKEGETYWLEYVGNDEYNVRSDNLLGKTYHITPGQLYTIFKKKTWLEKQGEQIKDYNSIDPHFGKSASETAKEEKVDNQNCSADKPKFNVGDWVVTDKNNIVQIKSIEENHYVLENTMRFTIEYVDKCWHKWTIEDAKDGDVLTTLDYILIFKEFLPKDGGVSYCHYGFGIQNPQFIYFEDKNWYFGKKAITHPATKEQRDLLFQKMKEAGYEWDAKKKKLKKKMITPIFNIHDVIIKKHNSDINDFGSFVITDISGGKYWDNDIFICNISEQDEWELYEPVRKPTDKVDSDKEVKERIRAINPNYPYKKDGLKPSFDEAQGTPQPEKMYGYEKPLNNEPRQEWGEEDERAIGIIKIALEHPYDMEGKYDRHFALDWLKSLKDRVLPQPKQKWSEEDERYLCDIIDKLSRLQMTNVGSEREKCSKAIDWLESLKNKVAPQKQWKPTKKQLIELRNVISGCSFETPVLVELEEQLKKLL